MTSILQAMGYIQDQADAGQKKGLARLLGSAYGAAPEQRQQILGTVAQRGGADMAFEADKHFAGMEDGARKQLGQDAAVLLALPADQRAQAYPGFAAKAQQLGIPAPMQWDDKFAAGLGQLATALGGAKTADTPSSVQEYLYAQNHPGFQDFLNGRQPTQLASIPVPGGTQTVQWNPRTRQMTDLAGNPVNAGGSSSGISDFQVEPGANIPAGDMPAVMAAAQNPGQVFVPQGRLGFKPDKPADAPDSFTTLTPAEVAQAGLPPGTFAQRNNKTGEIKVGPEAAQGPKPMSDYQRAQMQQKLVKAKTSIRGTVSDLDRMAEMARQVMQAPGLERTTGIMGALPNIPGSAAADAEAKLNSLKSQIAFAVLAKMRAMSPTGGALGSVSDAEGKRLEANLASLDKAQSYEQLRQNLQQIIDYTNTSKQNIESAFQDDFGEFQQGQQSAPIAPAAGGWKIEVVQ